MAWLTRAARLLEAGRPHEAIAPLRHAAQAQPGDAAILHDLGLACLENDQVTEAIAALQSAVTVHPGFADSHLRLGIALERARCADAALAAYHRATELQPTLADAHYRAGHLLDSLGRGPSAIEAFRRAAAAAPKTTLAQIADARAQLGENRYDEADRSLRRALAREPGNAVALELLGQTLADLGRFEEARSCFVQATERSASLAGSYYDLVRCRPILPADGELITNMRTALARPGLDSIQRSRVQLALGKAAEDLGDYAEAMRQFDAAEASRNGVVRFDLPAFEARVERLIACFTGELVSRARRRGADEGTAQEGAGPIVIFGLPRSGTTLIEQILSAHPQVHGGGELPFWNERGAAWERAGAGPPDDAWLAGAAADYRALLRGFAPAGLRVTDKMPLNFQWVGLIHLALPRAALIHCRRAPLDTALSIHRTHFNSRMPLPTGGAALVGYMRAYQRLTAHWRAVLPAGRFVEIDYESLVADPPPEIRRLVAACGLAWNDACLHPEHNARALRTPSKWQARRSIYSAAVGGWRAYEPWLGPLRALLD